MSFRKGGYEFDETAGFCVFCGRAMVWAGEEVLNGRCRNYEFEVKMVEVAFGEHSGQVSGEQESAIEGQRWRRE